MKTETKIGIFLCECGGKISNRIDLPEVCDLLRYGPWGHLGVYPYPCLAPGLEAMRQEVRAKGLDRILVGGCSSRLMKKRFATGLAPVGIEKHQVEMINLKDHVAAVHEASPQELARKAAALIAGGLASLKLLEPYKPVSLSFQGPALILGGGISGFAAARELARKGMESVLFSNALTPERVLDELSLDLSRLPHLLRGLGRPPPGGVHQSPGQGAAGSTHRVYHRRRGRLPRGTAAA